MYSSIQNVNETNIWEERAGGFVCKDCAKKNSNSEAMNICIYTMF